MRSVEFVEQVTYICDNCLARSKDVLPREWIAIHPDIAGICCVSPCVIVHTGKDDAVHFCSSECMTEFIENEGPPE